MKKSILMFLFIAITMTMFATNPIKFGLTGSVNSSSITSHPSSNIGYSGGILIEAPIISNKVYICPSIQYSSETFYFFYPRYSDVFNKNNFTFINAPLLIKLKFNPIGNGNMRLFTSFGPTLSYLLQVTNYHKVLKQSEMFGPETDFDLRKYNWSIGINLGIEFSKKYQISLGYNVGLTEITYNHRFLNPKTRIASLTLTYLL